MKASKAPGITIPHSLPVAPQSNDPVSLLADLEDFVTAHRPHGTLRATTGELTANGYRLEVACPCGVTFERWITRAEAADELLRAGCSPRMARRGDRWHSEG